MAIKVRVTGGKISKRKDKDGYTTYSHTPINASVRGNVGLLYDGPDIAENRDINMRKARRSKGIKKKLYGALAKVQKRLAGRNQPRRRRRR